MAAFFRFFRILRAGQPAEGGFPPIKRLLHKYLSSSICAGSGTGSRINTASLAHRRAREAREAKELLLLGASLQLNPAVSADAAAAKEVREKCERKPDHSSARTYPQGVDLISHCSYTKSYSMTP
jgi:hypothetical protein